MKVRVIVWTVVGILVAVGVVFLLASKRIPGGVAEFDRDDLLAFAGRMEERLAVFERRYERIKCDIPATPDADSSCRTLETRLVECHALLDSLRREEDTSVGVRIRKRAILTYHRAKDWLRKLSILCSEHSADKGD